MDSVGRYDGERTFLRRGLRSRIVTVALALPGIAAAQPDLVVNGVRLDAQNRLLVTIANEGDVEVPEGEGGLSIFIDGRSVGGYRLGNLADQSFRTPGGSLTIPTNFRLAGRYRRVMAVIDPQHEVEESNEHQNVRTRSLTAAELVGPDLVVTDLVSAAGSLWFWVRNLGNAATPPAFAVRARIIVDGVVVRDLDLALGALAPGGSRLVHPSLPVVSLPATHRVRVLLNAPLFLDELDRTNNVREEWLPAPPLLAELDRLLALPEIRNALAWEDDGLIRRYSTWTWTERESLRSAFAKLENGEPPGLTAPPVPIPGSGFSLADGWKIYVAHAAHALWIEARNAVPWSLLHLTAEERALLLDSRNVVGYIATEPPTAGYFFTEHGQLAAWDPEVSYRFLRDLRLVGASEVETLEAIGEWMRSHLIHAAGGASRLELYGYEGSPPVDRILYPIEGQKHWTLGCHATAPLFRALLHSVNVPVALHDPYDMFGHRRPIFPTLGLTMAHADNIHSRILFPSGNDIPIGLVFVTEDTFVSQYLEPPLDCEGVRCNLPVDQWSYNFSRDHWLNAIWYLGDGALIDYADGGWEQLELELVGDLDRYVRPLFSEWGRGVIRDRVEAELDRLGSGDRTRGREIVTERYWRFQRHRLD